MKKFLIFLFFIFMSNKVNAWLIINGSNSEKASKISLGGRAANQYFVLKPTQYSFLTHGYWQSDLVMHEKNMIKSVSSYDIFVYLDDGKNKIIRNSETNIEEKINKIKRKEEEDIKQIQAKSKQDQEELISSAVERILKNLSAEQKG